MAPSAIQTPPESVSSPTDFDIVSWTLARAEKWADRPIYIDSSDEAKSLTAIEVRSYTRKIISGLRSRGIKAGDTVCVISHNSIWYTPLYLGIIGAGARFVGANPAYSPGELQHVFTTATVNLVIAEPKLVGKAVTVLEDSGLSRKDLLVFEGEDDVEARGFESWHSLFVHGEKDWIRFQDERQARKAVASLMMTSGTTGMPKAAMISHKAHIVQAQIIEDHSLPKYYMIRRLLCIPQFHAFTIPIVHLAPLREGQSTYIMKRFDLTQYVRCIKKSSITEIAVVPPMVHSILSLPQSKHIDLNSLRHIWCAGAPLPADVQNRFVQILNPKLVFSQVWGMTEIGWITATPYPERDNTGSVGRLLPQFEAKVMSPSGDELQEGIHGEIYVRSPSMMLGYLGNSAATTDTIKNGWLRTGDIGYQRENKWYITDREKDLIKVRGWQVSPTEIEACLLMHPAVRDAAVIGVAPDDVTGELPRAYVILKPDVESIPDERDIKDHVSHRLAKFKSLAGGVRFVTSIPRNASGKTLRKVLQKLAVEELQQR